MQSGQSCLGKLFTLGSLAYTPKNDEEKSSTPTMWASLMLGCMNDIKIVGGTSRHKEIFLSCRDVFFSVETCCRSQSKGQATSCTSGYAYATRRILSQTDWEILVSYYTD